MTSPASDIPVTSPASVSGGFIDGRIVTEPSIDSLAKTVMGGTIVVVKGVFSDESTDLLSLRDEVFGWAQETPPVAEPDPDANSHCLQAGVSRLQRTPHIYHSYNFNRISQLPSNLPARLTRYFEALTAFQNTLTGNSARLEDIGDSSGPKLHPQLIQYPLGGGMFGRHVHSLLPQRIGVIVALSRRGIDFARGGTCFATEDGVTDIELDHDLGDIALFRYDIPHWVNASNLVDKFDWDSGLGRWSMLLPYY